MESLLAQLSLRTGLGRVGELQGCHGPAIEFDAFQQGQFDAFQPGQFELCELLEQLDLELHSRIWSTEILDRCSEDVEVDLQSESH